MNAMVKAVRDRLADRQNSSDATFARGLGWASLAIGLTEIAAPHQIESCMGIGNGENTGVLRTLGVREILHGIDILSHDDPTPGLWSRVAGDALDSTLLAIAAKKTRRPGGFACVCAAVAVIGVLDVLFADRLSKRR